MPCYALLCYAMQVLKTQVMHDPHTRESRGFAFVTFETAEEADAAIAGMNGVELSGRTLVVQKARRARARSPTPGRYRGHQKGAFVYPLRLCLRMCLCLYSRTFLCGEPPLDQVQGGKY